MNPGEYIGKDGRTYRWVHEYLSDDSGSGYDHQVFTCHWETEWIAPEDWPAAKAALDALIEAEKEAEEWVEINPHWRVNREGRWQYRQCEGLTSWFDKDPAYPTDEAYRKGREVALAEYEALREQEAEKAKTRKLEFQVGLEKALASLYCRSTNHAVCVAELCDEYLDRTGAALGRVRDIAKRVQL